LGVQVGPDGKFPSKEDGARNGIRGVFETVVSGFEPIENRGGRKKSYELTGIGEQSFKLYFRKSLNDELQALQMSSGEIEQRLIV
jgi:hypothetical protein